MGLKEPTRIDEKKRRKNELDTDIEVQCKSIKYVIVNNKVNVIKKGQDLQCNVVSKLKDASERKMLKEAKRPTKNPKQIPGNGGKCGRQRQFNKSGRRGWEKVKGQMLQRKVNAKKRIIIDFF